jgi:hypothetical protein
MKEKTKTRDAIDSKKLKKELAEEVEKDFLWRAMSGRIMK